MSEATFTIALIDSQHYKGDDFSAITTLCTNAGGKLLILQCQNDDEIVAQAQEADALLVVYAPVGHALLSRLPKCRIAVRLGIGVDNYDLNAFTENKVIACNVPDYGVEEVAAHSLGLILATERKIPFYQQRVREGEWNNAAGYPMRRLSTRTLGIFGFGRIARKLAECLAPLGYHLIAFDPFVKADVFEQYKVRSVDLKSLFQQSHTLVMMAPLTEQTKHIVNDENLALAQDGLRIVNTARGELIDTQALIRGLENGKVAAAGLDVIEGEPVHNAAHPIFQYPNVYLTPHTAYQTVESVALLKTMGLETAIDFLKGQAARNVVNPDVLQMI
ncbi:Glyoxylate/hydroxypyruvate reductase B [Thalassocella blandensis]|nr:Glyoxylate/hydroxypyruvate reductase B [Thalassocella blandensis]